MTTTEIVVQSEDCHISDLCDSLKVPTNISSLATDLWSKLRMDNPDDFKVIQFFSSSRSRIILQKLDFLQTC